jgi:hypothetical protein
MFRFEPRILIKLSMRYSRIQCMTEVDWSLFTWIWGSHSSGYEKFSILRYNRVVRSKSLLSTSFVLVSRSAYSSTLKMWEKCSSETSTCFQRTTRSYISEYLTLSCYLCATMGTSHMNGVQWFSYFWIDPLIRNFPFYWRKLLRRTNGCNANLVGLSPEYYSYNILFKLLSKSR